MTLSLTAQTVKFLIALGLGVVLGILYDFGRAIRRVAPILTLPVDILFGLTVFLALFLTSLYTGGLTLYQLLGIMGGGGLWFLTLGRIVLRMLVGLLLRFRRQMGILWSGGKKSVKFLRKLVKKLFPSSRKWGTIDMIPFSPKKQKKARQHLP